MDLFKSRKFWMAIATAVLTVVGHFWVEMPQEAILTMVSGFIAAILGQAAVDIKHGGSRPPAIDPSQNANSNDSPVPEPEQTSNAERNQ